MTTAETQPEAQPQAGSEARSEARSESQPEAQSTAQSQSEPQSTIPTGFAYDGGLTCAISVTNLDAAVDWYSTVLGMTLLYRRDDIAFAELTTGVARVTVGLSQNESAGGPGGATLTFGVMDLDAAHAALVAAGVRLDGPIQDIPEMVRLLTFYDPDGNALMFYEDLTTG